MRRELAALAGLVIWVGIWGTGCVRLEHREDENLKILLDDVYGACPVWGNGVIYLWDCENMLVLGVDTATLETFTLYTLPPGFYFYQPGFYFYQGLAAETDMDISPDLSKLVFPVIDTHYDMWLFLIDTSRQEGNVLKDSVYVGDGCSFCRPRFSESGDKVFFRGGYNYSELLVWDLASDRVDTIMDAPGFFQDLLPHDTGFIYGQNPFKTYSFNTGLSGELPNTEDWDFIEVNPIYRDCAVCWRQDTLLLLYDLLDLTGKTKGASPYLGGEFWEVSWSPDGRSIVFIYLRAAYGSYLDLELWIYRNITDFF